MNLNTKNHLDSWLATQKTRIVQISMLKVQKMQKYPILEVVFANLRVFPQYLLDNTPKSITATQKS